MRIHYGVVFILGVVSVCWACQSDDDSGSAGSSGGAGMGSSAGNSSVGSSSAGSSSAGSSSAGNTAGASAGSSVVDATQAKNFCYAQCDAQANLADCDPFVSNQECKGLCDAIVKGTPDECLGDFAAYYECTLMDGFKCSGTTFVLPNSDQCQDEQDALDECVNGPGGTQCEGQNENGVCPQVACPCPEGTKMVSGFDTEGGGCRCLDSETCKDLFCD